MGSFEDFIKQSGATNPPTENETAWSKENFSSRVDPPIVEPEVCILGPLLTSFNMVLQGLEVSGIFTGHLLKDVPFGTTVNAVGSAIKPKPIPEDPNPPPFQKTPLIHLASVASFDYLEKPYNVIGTEYEARWDEVIKPGRYGEGKCARIDATFYIADTVLTGPYNVCEQGPCPFISGSTLTSLSSNMENGNTLGPNGYGCVLPRTQRVHVYQKPGSAWIVSAFLNVYTDGTADHFIALKDGQLRRYENSNAVTTGVFTVLADIPDTVNKWYDLEIRQDPDSPVLPNNLPTVPSGAPLAYVPITWRFLINGVEYYSEHCFSLGYEIRGHLGFSLPIGTTEVFLDNYYTVFMTADVGVPTLENTPWVIRNTKPVHDACRGQWSGLDMLTNVTTIEADYTDYVNFVNSKAVVQHTFNMVLGEDSPYTCLDGNYTKFNYDIPIPPGSTLTWTYANTLERYNTSSHYYNGVWIMEGNHPGYSEREYTGIGTAKGTFVAPLDPYWRISMLLNAATKRQEVYYKYLPIAKVSGSINIGTEYRGYDDLE